MTKRDAHTRPSLQAMVVEELGRAIAHGTLVPGATLRIETVQQQLGVSRTVVREAMRALEARGLVHAKPKVGTVVLPIEHWSLLDANVVTWRSDGPQAYEQLADLMIVRRALEPTAAALAATQFTDRDLETLRGLLDTMRSAHADDDSATFGHADTAFHETVYRASGSPALRQLIETLVATMRARYADTHAVFSVETAQSLVAHGQLLHALEAHDATASEDVARRLVDAAMDEISHIPSLAGST